MSADMSTAGVPSILWQMTGNHWITLPCIHPDDASVRLVGLMHRGGRGALEFAGSAAYQEPDASPFMSFAVTLGGEQAAPALTDLRWERLLDWIPAFTAQLGTVTLRGSIFAPFGRGADIPGFVYVVALENPSSAAVRGSLVFSVNVGHRQLRVRTAREFSDAHRVVQVDGGVIVCEGAALPGMAALALGAEEDPQLAITMDAAASSCRFEHEFEIPPGETWTRAIYCAAGAERDAAVATFGAMRRAGWRTLLERTSHSLRELRVGEQQSSVSAIIDRNLVFAYFYGVGRAIDDGQFYCVRSRAPWHHAGLTWRDWESLVWLLPAVQLMDPVLGRELLIRACEVHAYAAGNGVHYLDGALFQPGFSLEGLCAYAIAVDRFIRETGDEQIVEDPIVAETLYTLHEEIVRRRDTRYPLYSGEIQPDGEESFLPFTLHGNATAAMALDVLSRTLDEETAREVESATAVRAAMQRHFTVDVNGQKVLAGATDLEGNVEHADHPASSAAWLPLYEAIDRNDSLYRRTAKRLTDSGSVVRICADLQGPRAEAAAAFLKSAPLYQGVGCEMVDETGAASSGAGDAAVAALLAWSLWQAVHVRGLRI